MRGLPNDALLLIGRILIASLFLPAGVSTLSDIAASTTYFAGLGLPMPALAAWATGVFEIVTGALILAGLQTTLTALALAGFCVAAAFIGQYGQGGDDAVLRFMHQQAFRKDIAIAGGLLFLAVCGAGAYSLDARVKRT